MTFGLDKIVAASFATTDSICECVFDIDLFNDANKFAISLSNNTISIYDTATLSSIVNVVAHEDRINSIQCSKFDPNIYFTASSDRSASVWDLRSRVSALRISEVNEVFSISSGLYDRLVAISAGNSAIFYDIRNPGGKGKKLGVYSDCHSDDINVVQFCPYNPSHLVTAGEDGLICMYDTSVSCGNIAVESIMNTESPIRRLGFFGADERGIACLSSIETLTAWHHQSAQLVCKFPDIRSTMEVEYLVDIWYTNNTLYVLGGDYSGNGKIGVVTPTGITMNCSSNIVGGHNNQIRCAKLGIVTSDSAVPFLLTGGEDGRICLWTDVATGPSYSGTSSTSLRRLPTQGPGSSSSAAAAAGGILKTTHSTTTTTTTEMKKSNGIRYTPY